MKKFLKLFSLVLTFALTITSLASCGTPLDPGQGKDKNTKSEIYIVDGSTQTKPYSVFRYSQSYNEEMKQWLSADGEGMFESPALHLQKNEDKIPAVSPENIEIDISSNGTLSKVEIYSKTDSLEISLYDLKTTLTLGKSDIFAEAKAAFSALTEGTYYVALYVEWKGDFIESDNGGRYEGSGYTYYFKIVI